MSRENDTNCSQPKWPRFSVTQEETDDALDNYDSSDLDSSTEEEVVADTSSSDVLFS